MLALARDLGTQYKTAFVLAHKIREAMAAEVRRTPIGGKGRKAEVDGGYFGGYVKPAQPPGEPPRSAATDEPERQTQGRGRDPRARPRWQDAPRRVRDRGRGAQFHPA